MYHATFWVLVSTSGYAAGAARISWTIPWALAGAASDSRIARRSRSELANARQPVKSPLRKRSCVASAGWTTLRLRRASEASFRSCRMASYTDSCESVYDAILQDLKDG